MHVFELTAKKMAIVRLNTCLDLIAESCGRIGFIPLVLSLVPVKVTIDASSMTVYVFQLDIRMSMLEITQNQRQATPLILAQTPANQDLPLLENGPQEVTEPQVDLTTNQPTTNQPTTNQPATGQTTIQATTGEFDRLYLTCRERIELMPVPEHKLLLKTLGNMRHIGDLKGFKAYLESKTEKHATAAA
jgi:hypothetical protein